MDKAELIFKKKILSQEIKLYNLNSNNNIIGNIGLIPKKTNKYKSKKSREIWIKQNYFQIKKFYNSLINYFYFNDINILDKNKFKEDILEYMYKSSSLI